MSEKKISTDHEPRVEIQWESVKNQGRVATIAIKGRTHLNIIGRQIILETIAAFQETLSYEDLRVIILTGWGDAAFIGGVDIGEMANLNEESARIFIRSLHELCQAIRKTPVPVFAKIQGYCLGGGLEVAAACDLRIASASSKFGMPEVRVGIPSVIEAALLPQLIGWGKTRELVLLGNMLNADQAIACGLIERLVPQEELDQAVEACVENICEAGPQAIRLQKELINRWEELPLEEAIEAGIGYFARAYQTDEPQRMMAGFLNRKK